MKKIKRSAIFIGLLLLTLMGGFFFGKFDQRHHSPTEITADLVGTRLEAASDLITTKYYYHNTASFENNHEFYGWKVPFTSKRFLVSYDGVIHAGIPMSRTVIEVIDEEIHITLPPTEVVAHEIKENSTKVLDEKSALFNPIELTDFITFADDQKIEIEKQAIANGLLTEAETNAKATIREVLNLSTDIQENFQIIFN